MFIKYLIYEYNIHDYKKHEYSFEMSKHCHIENPYYNGLS